MNIIIKFLIAEIIAYFLFSGLNARFFPGDRPSSDGELDHYFSIKRLKEEIFSFNIENTKGILERALLVVGLYFGITHVIIFFGAIKIGSRLDSSNSNKATINYFIIGNIISVLIAIFVVKLKYVNS